VDAVIQLVDSQKQFIHQLEPALQFQRNLESNFQLLTGIARRFEDRLERLSQHMEELVKAQTRTEAQVGTMAEAQARTEERLDSFAALIEELAKTQKHTEARMEELAAAQVRTETRLEELAAAQKRTEERMGQLELRMEELAEAQKRTEERMGLLELRMEELAEAQKRTEERLNGLSLRMDELAAAQQRTEARLAELVVAQAHSEARIQELAEAQARTEARLDRTNKLLGDLSMSFGYLLQNQAYKQLPHILSQEHGITVQGKLTRAYVQDITGQYIEVNILGEGIRNGDRYFIVGESKSQLSENSIDRFIRKKWKRVAVPEGRILFPILVCHMITSRDVEEYAKQKGITLVYSHQF
jgi:uncharacterized coiled-coil protein SlyX